MRIAFFTPFDCDSAVGKCSRLILPALGRRHDIEIWSPTAPRLMDAPAPVIPFEPRAALGDPRLDRYDLLLFQMGNDPNRFNRILQVSQHCPGIHILADHTLHGLSASYYMNWLRQPIGYLRAVERAYGDRARQLAEDSITGVRQPLWESDLAGEFPLFEPVLENSLGVVVFSGFHLQAIRRVFSGPSTVVNMPATPVTGETKVTRSTLGVPQDRAIILSSGYVNRTKLNGVVIEALHRSPDLAKRVLFVIAGELCPAEGPRLRAMVRDHQLEQSVRFTGYLSDEMLHAWLVHSEFCVNLRRPNTESASGSLAQQMLHGKAVVVLPSGFYGEMPEHAVVRIEPDGLDSIHELLLRLARDHSWRTRVGRAAKKFAEASFDPDVCGESISAFLEQIHAQKPEALR